MLSDCGGCVEVEVEVEAVKKTAGSRGRGSRLQPRCFVFQPHLISLHNNSTLNTTSPLSSTLNLGCRRQRLLDMIGSSVPEP